jgi:hypothetical protein
MAAVTSEVWASLLKHIEETVEPLFPKPFVDSVRLRRFPSLRIASGALVIANWPHIGSPPLRLAAALLHRLVDETYAVWSAAAIRCCA